MGLSGHDNGALIRFWGAISSMFSAANSIKNQMNCRKTTQLSSIHAYTLDLCWGSTWKCVWDSPGLAKCLITTICCGSDLRAFCVTKTAQTGQISRWKSWVCVEGVFSCRKSTHTCPGVALMQACKQQRQQRDRMGQYQMDCGEKRSDRREKAVRQKIVKNSQKHILFT